MAAGKGEAQVLRLKPDHGDARRRKKDAPPSLRSNVPSPINAVFFADEEDELFGFGKAEEDHKSVKQ